MLERGLSTMELFQRADFSSSLAVPVAEGRRGLCAPEGAMANSRHMLEGDGTALSARATQEETKGQNWGSTVTMGADRAFHPRTGLPNQAAHQPDAQPS